MVIWILLALYVLGTKNNFKKLINGYSNFTSCSSITTVAAILIIINPGIRSRMSAAIGMGIQLSVCKSIFVYLAERKTEILTKCFLQKEVISGLNPKYLLQHRCVDGISRCADCPDGIVILPTLADSWGMLKSCHKEFSFHLLSFNRVFGFSYLWICLQCSVFELMQLWCIFL